MQHKLIINFTDFYSMDSNLHLHKFAIDNDLEPNKRQLIDHDDEGISVYLRRKLTE